MKKYLYVHVKLYEFEKTWSFRYLSDEDIYKKGDYVWVQVEDVELPVIVTKSVWYDENEVPWPLDKMKSIIRRSSREEYLKHNEWSILNYILSRLDKNSKLPDDFSLNKYRSLENNFVDGALDGISLFHTDFEEDTDLTKKICDLINNKEEDLIKAVEIFDKSIGDNIIRPSLYSINEYVDNNINELTYEFIYGLAHTMIYRSKNPEVVKLGIFLISNFKISNIDKELYYVFNKMVLCNEFSDLIGGCIFPLYKNTNKLLFDAAKKVTGWGRIFLLYRVDFDTDEKKEWLLREGYNNDIHIGYTATYVLTKIDTVKLLKDKNISLINFENISWLINESIFPGPGVEIDRIDNYKEIFEAYLDLFDKFNDNYLFFATVKNIYAHEGKEYDRALNILETDKCYEIVKEKMYKGKRSEALNLIDICNITKKHDYTDVVLDRFNSNIMENAFCLDYLLNNDKTKDSILERLNSGSDIIDSVEINKRLLYQLLLELEDHPLVGLPYIYKALESGDEELEGQIEWVINRWFEEGTKIPKDLQKYINETDE